jgi:predicted TIM-barrel fold metal-dependent hydrolase
MSHPDLSSVAFADACDCHVRLRQADAASLRVHEAVAQGLGLYRSVLVHAGQGADPARLAALLAGRGRSLCAVATLGPLTPEATLEQLALLGVRGLRLVLNHGTAAADAAAELQDLARRADRRNCHVELTAPAALIARLAPVIRDAATPVVIDRMADADPDRGLRQAGLDQMLELLSAGRIWVKLTAAPSSRHKAADMLPVMRAVIATNVHGVVWGGDWPCGAVEALARRAEAAGSADNLRLILVENPARLYRFAD